MRPSTLLWILVLGAGGFFLLLINTGFTLLKEDPAFWRNAGGYSIGLRELVLSCYYPLLSFNILLCVTYSGFAVRASRWAIGSAALLWCLLFLNIGLLTANNLQNLLAGRPLHYHPPSALPR